MRAQPAQRLTRGGPAQATAEVVLLHGVGSHPGSMRDLGRAIAAVVPAVELRAPPAPFLRDDGTREWFSVAGITEHNRIQRLAGARGRVLDAVFPDAEPAGRRPGRSVIVVGYSQGGIVALDLRDRLRWPRLHVVAVHARWADRHPAHQPAPGRAVLISASEDAVFPLKLVEDQVAYRATHGDRVLHWVSPGDGHAMSGTTHALVVEAVRRIVQAAVNEA